MLPADHRLRRRRDFGVAVRRGRRAGSSTVLAHLAAPAGVSVPARVGFVVGTAVGPAVTRNRVRRQLRHLTVPELARLPAGALLVVRALPAAAGASSTQLAADLTAILGRLLARSSSEGAPA